MIELRPYQREAIDAILAARDRGVLRQLVALPTGTGKTVIFASLARELGARTLVLAHRDELIQQAADKFRLLWPDVDLGVVKAERNETGHQVTIASVQTLSRPGRRATLGDPDLLITDEAHHAVAPTYRRIYDQVGEVLHVGVTATPQRGDKAGLSAVFAEVVYHRPLLDMIRAHYLADLRGLRLRTEVDLEGVRTVAGDFVEADLAEAVNTAERNACILAGWQEHAADRQTLVFTVDVQHARDLAKVFQDAGVEASVVSGETPIEERRELLQAFGRGDLQVLCNCAVLTEGYDEPSIDCILVARPTQSQGLYVQMIGRGTRLHPGKSDCLVVDVADNTRRHRLAQLPNLFGLEYPERETTKPTPTVLEQVQERARVAARGQGRMVAEAVDLFDRSRFTWLAVGDSWVLGVPKSGQIRLLPYDGQYLAYFYPMGDGERRLLTERPLDLGWAQGVAEDEARRLLEGRWQVIARDAPWRGQPASEKQIATLIRMRIPHWVGITKGEASDLIGRKVAEWKTA